MRAMQFSADFRADAIGCVWRGKMRQYYTAMAGVALAGGVGIVGMDKGDERDGFLMMGRWQGVSLNESQNPNPVHPVYPCQ